MLVHQKRVIWACWGVGVLLLAFSGWLWWTRVYQSPQNVFWGTLSNNLATTSVTKHFIQGQGGQSVDQYAQLLLNGQDKARWLVSIKQSNANVTTESIGTPTAGYVRYTAIHTSQKDKNGKPVDFSSLLNVWAKSSKQDNSSLSGLFAQTLFDVSNAPAPPLGNISSTQRADLIDYMRKNNVFSTVYSAAKDQKVNNQEAYVYTVQVKLEPYVHMMQTFAHDEGMTELDNIDASNYQDSAPATITLAMSPTAHQLIQLKYTDGQYQVDYSSYGANTSLALPAHSISVQELQSRLQKLQ